MQRRESVKKKLKYLYEMWYSASSAYMYSSGHVNHVANFSVAT